MTKYGNSKVHYARNVHGQPNNNASFANKRMDWKSAECACASDVLIQPMGGAVSSYFDNITMRKPWTLTGHDFQLNIPNCAYVTKITFTARMRVQGKIDVKAPYARFNLYHGTKSVENNIKNDTGWDNGFYYCTANKSKLSNSSYDFKYVMTGKEFYRRGYPNSELNELRMGIDLRFYDAKSHETMNYVVVDFISCYVEYELPDQKVTFATVTSEDNPLITRAGVEYEITANYKNYSNASCCNANDNKISLKLPPNASVTRVITGDFNNGVWTVPCTPNASATLKLKIRNWGVGEEIINLSNANLSSTMWVYSVPQIQDIGTVAPYPNTMQQGITSCVTFVAKVNASDGTANFIVDMDTANHSARDVVWFLVEEETTQGVSIVPSSCDDTHVNFNVPRNTVVDIVFKGCFIPNFTGDSGVSVKLGDNTPVTVPYHCLSAPVFVVRNNSVTSENDRDVAEIILNPSQIKFITHRLPTTTEIEATIIEVGVDDGDSEMEVSDCNLTANSWEKINYIGMVPLKYPHYDPHSDYENKEIWEDYKNKTYAGKEGSIDEDISLKFKAPPRDVTTLQGLVKLDAPTPINTNWKIWEGDSLNHRGWAVLSKISAERTNPLYYDVEAKVRYITHDIHTKFQIFKGLLVNNISMPDFQADLFELGENLSTGLDLFDIQTDGGFMYDSDNGGNNIFTLDEGQKLSIKTRDSLTDVSSVRFDWYSTRVSEFNENRLERIFRLFNNNGECVLEYEYTDFVFESEFVSCTAIVRYMTDEGGWKILTYPIDLKTEMELEPIADDVIDVDSIISIDEEEEEPSEEDTDYDSDTNTSIGVDEDSEEDEVEEEYIAPSPNLNDYNLTLIYGSSLLFELNNNSLIISDEGYNGREVHTEPLQLIGTGFTFETEWQNNNIDGETEDILTYININLTETVLTTKYSDVYKDLIISPFPIPDKKLVFTRESEEGTLFYLTGQDPFKYMLEPYYQYHCGCDLISHEGVSIFDLNNSYTSYYIENGLVRFGFNKFSGSMTLGKWDIVSKQWITTHYLHMSNDVKFSLEQYSEDKIVIKAGTDTYFTIWRGHPYIMINNPTDTVYIDSKFNYCLSDEIDDVSYPYPIISSFMNTNNLLPLSIGGKQLDYDDILIDDDNVSSGTSRSISVNINGDIIEGEAKNINISISPSIDSGKVYYIVDDVTIDTVTYPFTLNHTFSSDDKVLQAVYVGDDGSIAFSDKILLNVQAPTVRPNTVPDVPEIQGAYNLSIVSAPDKMTYRDQSEVVLQLKRGQTNMYKLAVELQMPDGSTDTKYTNRDGKIRIVNDNVDFVPAKYQWGGRFYDGTDDDNNRKLICKALKWITVEKATPKFTHSGDGFVSQGGKLTVKLNGVDAMRDKTKKGLVGKKVVYSIDGGANKTATTNANGKFSIKCNLPRGVHKIKCKFAGSPRYNPINETFNIKVYKSSDFNFN